MRCPLLSSVIFLSTVGLFMGCGGNGPANLKLTGKITINGQPAQNVDITLHAQDGQMFSGKAGDDGTFTISGVPPGEMAVTITSGAGGGYQASSNPTSSGPQGAATKYGGSKNRPDDTPKKQQTMDPKAKEKMKENMKEMEGKMPTPPTATKIPSKYSDKTKSGLSWSVSSEQLTKDFVLTD